MSRSVRATLLPTGITAVAAAAVVTAYVVGAGAATGRAAAAPVALPAAAPAAATVATVGVTVSGVGTVAGTPDLLRLDLSVTAKGTDPAAALAAVTAPLDRVRRSLRGSGVAPADLQTTGLSVQAEYAYDKSGAHLRGYTATESLRARLHDLRRAGQAVGAAVAAGGSAVRVDGISLDLDNDTPLVTRARDRAFGSARAKAQQYASLSGRRLGPVTAITENVAAGPPIAVGDSLALRSAAAVPIEAGSQDVTVTVEVVFSLR